MAIADNNPERRNLVLLSAAIIAFYVGECEFQERGHITLPLLKLTFTNPNGLAVVVWIMLLWFAWRYYLSAHQDTEGKIFRELTQGEFGLSLFKSRIQKLLNKDYDEKIGRVIYWQKHHSIGNTDEKDLLVIKYVPKSPRGSNPQPYDSFGPDESPECEIYRDGQTKFIYYISRLILFFKKPYQSEYYAPFIIFYIAVGFGVVNYFSEPDLPSATLQEVQTAPVESNKQVTNEVISQLNKLVLDVYSKGKDDARSEILRALGFQSNSELPPVQNIDIGSNHAQGTTPSGE